MYGAYVVWVKWCYNWSSRIAAYLVGKYVSRLKHLGGGWMSYSKGWLWSGWRKTLKRLLVSNGRETGLRLWKVEVMKNARSWIVSSSRARSRQSVLSGVV